MRSTPGIAILCLVLGGAAGWLLFGRAAPSEAASPPPLAPDLAAWREDLRALAARVAALEVGRAPARVATGEAAHDDVRQRLAELETRVQRLSAATSANVPAPSAPLPQTAAEVREALRDKNLYGNDVPAALVQRRLALRQRLLELTADAPGAANTLAELVQDLLITNEAQRARQVLAQWGARAGMPEWRLHREYAAVDAIERRFADARERYARVAADARAPEDERLSARFWQAYSFLQEGRDAEARPLFEALVAEYGEQPSPQLRSTVEGARQQLQRLTERERGRRGQSRR